MFHLDDLLIKINAQIRNFKIIQNKPSKVKKFDFVSDSMNSEFAIFKNKHKDVFNAVTLKKRI